jgi:2-desacetyl-2-hydroxyethyl bacteriochlorophyllide A dehydrogenase
MKTQAVVFPEANRFELRELTLKEPGPADMVVRTVISAISPGTERWCLRGLHLGSTFPCVPGYHRIGVVESKGSDVSAFDVGDVVYGTGNAWQEGVTSMWGAHVGRSVSPAGGYRLVAKRMPEQPELEGISFAILAGVSNRGVNAANIQPGQTILHIGAGIVGICAAQLAIGRGAKPVLLDKSPERIAFLADAQPQLTVLSVDDPNLDARLAEFAPGGFDILQDTVGHAPTTDAMVKKVRNQGTLLLQAQYFDKEKCALDLDQIKVRELTIKTTCGTRQEDWDQVIANVRAGVLQIPPLITHRLTAAQALAGYELLHTGTPHNLGMVIRW